LRKGKVYEEIALEYLRKLGYRILERNFRCRFGEIDIVALDGDTLVFVEVKGGKGEGFGHPAERFTRSKLKRILACGHEFMKKGRRGRFRVDLVVVLEGRVDHIKNVGFF
jgi:putative endonuclease